MKNKTLTYVLIAVVVGVWYQVFMRVKSNFTADELSVIQNSIVPTKFISIERDTFTLEANYRDPFGSAVILSSTPIEVEKPQSFQEPPKIKKEVIWPKIKYFGLVRKTESNNPLGIINIDGMLLHLRKGESIFDDIKILAVGRDSILVKYANSKKTFWRD